MAEKSFGLELDQFRFCCLLELGNILNLSEPVSCMQTGITLLQKDVVKLNDAHTLPYYENMPSKC